jgi:membrane-associated phospholipid phosphatase
VAAAVLVRALAFGGGWAEREDVALLWRIGSAHDTAAFALASAVTAAFDPAPYAVLVLLVLGVAVAGGRPAAGAIGVATVAAATLTTELLKHALAESRPANPYLPPDAWPSGHATAAAALVAALLIVTPPGRRRPVAVGGGVLVVAVAASLVIIGVHFPSDVLGGALIAGAWGAAGLSLASRVPSDGAGRRARS